MWDGILKHQANYSDYLKLAEHNRGHLYPSCHAFEKDDKISTFTLTNIVPQAITFNSGSWQKMEECAECVMQNYCVKNGITEGYVVTGAKPGKNKLKGKVNIPSVLWSAFCCYSSKMNKWIASAHWGDNVSEPKNKDNLPTKTLEELRKKLGFEAFSGRKTQCPHNSNVAEFYPNLLPECNCPPKGFNHSISQTNNNF